MSEYVRTYPIVPLQPGILSSLDGIFGVIGHAITNVGCAAGSAATAGAVSTNDCKTAVKEVVKPFKGDGGGDGSAATPSVPVIRMNTVGPGSPVAMSKFILPMAAVGGGIALLLILKRR